MAGRPTLAMLAVLAAATGCVDDRASSQSDLSQTAESFFRSVYGCEPDGIRALAHPEVALSYPIFSTLYDVSVIRGMEPVVEFSENFCRRWQDASIIIDDAIVQGNRVVLIWSFSATDQIAEDPSTARQSWGGISVFRFDSDGRVLEEFGEESAPGPTARLSGSGGA